MRRWLTLLTLVACTVETPCERTGPAGELVCGGARPARLGVDVAGTFVPHEDGAPLVLVRGEQGLQHVELDVQLDLDPDRWAVDRALVDVGAWRAADDVPVVPLDSWGVGLVADGDATRVRGLRWVVPDRELALGARVVVAVRVTPVGLDEAHAAWAEGDVVGE